MLYSRIHSACFPVIRQNSDHWKFFNFKILYMILYNFLLPGSSDLPAACTECSQDADVTSTTAAVTMPCLGPIISKSAPAMPVECAGGLCSQQVMLP